MSLRERLYTYDTLPTDRSIRLIQFVSDPTEPHGFSLTLQTVNVDDDPDFCALTYTKQSAVVSGTANNPDDDGPPAGVYVTCDGKKLAVSENAFDFLCQVFRDGLFLNTSGIPEGDGKSAIASFVSSHAPDGQVLPLKHIWIDGISTNQKDVAERGSQVFIRGDIFKQSKMTIVWLGREDPHPGVLWVAHTFLPLFMALQEEKGSEFFTSKDPDFTHTEIIERLGEEVCARWRKEYLHFCVFLIRRRWFLEGRSVQDVVSNSLGKSKVAVMLSGSSTMCWWCFNRFMSWLSPTGWRRSLTDRLRLHVDYPDTLRSRPTFSATFHKLHVIHSIQRHIQEACGGGTTGTGLDIRYRPMTDTERAHALLLEVLFQMRGRKFLDKRDVVYASYSLASHYAPPKPVMGKVEAGTATYWNLAINYQLPAAQVYTQATWSILKNTPYLTILGNVGRADKKETDGLPSWVPDFSVPLGITRLNVPPPGTQRPNFDASKARSPTGAFRLLSSGDALQLRGIRILTVISNISPKLKVSGELDLDWLLKAISQLHQDQTLANPYSNPPPDAENLKPPPISPTEAVTRALFADGFPASIPKSDLAKAIRQWWAHCVIRQCRIPEVLKQGTGAQRRGLAWRVAGVANPPTANHLETEAWFPSQTELHDMLHAYRRPFTQQTHEDNIAIAALDRLIFRIWGANNGISFFRSTDGRFGFGPSTLQVGDEVWLLEGGQTPIILRKDPMKRFEMRGTSSTAAEVDPFISAFSRLLSGGGPGSGVIPGYRVLGEAYVQGVMYGELVNMELLGSMGPVVLI